MVVESEEEAEAAHYAFRSTGALRVKTRGSERSFTSDAFATEGSLAPAE